MVELIAASWLADHDVLSSHGAIRPNPGNNVIDLIVEVMGHRLGVEVKSDLDAFETEFMVGSYEGDPKALRPRLVEQFGDDVRIQFRWLGDRPPREGWGRIREEVRQSFAHTIGVTRPRRLGSGDKLKITGKLERTIGGCRGAEVVVSAGPLVNVGIHFAGDGWEEVADRIQEHATSKAARTNDPFMLLYLSQYPQPASFDVTRMAWAHRHLKSAGTLPAHLWGVLHLHLNSNFESGKDVAGFLTATCPLPWSAFSDALAVRAVPETSGVRPRRAYQRP